MGADLICWMLMGPEEIKLSRGLRQNVLNKCNEVVFAAKQVVAGKANKKQRALVSDLDEVETENLCETDPETVLDSFLNVWNGGEGRDVNFRVFKVGGKTRKFLVSGDMSWGDEPDGYGYQTIGEARRLGLFPLLGIE